MRDDAGRGSGISTSVMQLAVGAVSCAVSSGEIEKPQTLTVIVRGIALGELTWGNTRKALIKEAIVGLGNGLALGTVGALVVFLMKGNPVLGGVLGLAMVINMFIAATAGTLIPLGLRALKVDPALASSVFITTFTDVAGFASFLGLATVFLKYLKPG